MKKMILIILPLTMVMLSCKKDRKCHCKITTDYFETTGPTPAVGTKNSTSIVEADVVMEKTGRMQAFKACVHTKTTHYNGAGVKEYEEDNYCELK